MGWFYLLMRPSMLNAAKGRCRNRAVSIKWKEKYLFHLALHLTSFEFISGKIKAGLSNCLLVMASRVNDVVTCAVEQQKWWPLGNTNFGWFLDVLADHKKGRLITFPYPLSLLARTRHRPPTFPSFVFWTKICLYKNTQPSAHFDREYGGNCTSETSITLPISSRYKDSRTQSTSTLIYGKSLK
jgi:hypothetical protein